MNVSHDLFFDMYRRMIRIREFELAAIDLFKRGQVKGAVHPYIGQEASGVGVCMALRADDLIAGTHRSHGHNIAKGASTKKMMAEILGKETGYCKGRGGSMHIAAFETGSLGALAVVGSGIPLAIGAALAFKMRGEDRVAVPFTGDAGSNTGNWHEALNMASLWQAPILYVLENNRIAQTTPVELAVAGNIRARFEAFGIPTRELDSSDVCEILPEASGLLDEVRSLNAPRALILRTFRFGPHSKGDDTRDPGEVERMRKQRDPLAIHGSRLSIQDQSVVESGVDALLDTAFQTALGDPYPQDE